MELELKLQQKEALSAIESFLADRSQSVFILKGYAGTGKTTLLKRLVTTIKELKYSPILMAPTGRAAKVLREKTGYEASTIHRWIYALRDMQVILHDEEGNIIKTDSISGVKKIRSKGSDDIQLWFPIKQHGVYGDPDKRIIIVDEASMISSKHSNDIFLHFGTDVLIDDLLTFLQPGLGGKIIFVGDPAQLLPVGDNRSVALDESYFEEKQLPVKSFELTEILRQGGESVILKNAMLVRDLLYSEHRNQLYFERKSGEVEDVLSEQVADSFFESQPYPSIGDSVIICYTNFLVKQYNDSLRSRYFPDKEHVVAGDILQVVQNCYNNGLDECLFNGDFVKVLDVSEDIETLSAPVWTDVAGERKRVQISIDFRDVVLLLENGKQLKCKIVDTLLNSSDSKLTHLQRIALYINFNIRFRDSKKSKEMFYALKSDPYYNAIRVKYGYAITGHKSQGGEWKNVYVDYSQRTGLNDDSLRWVYTVTTRAGERLYGVNMPSITPITGLKFNEIVKANKPSNEAFAYAEANDVPLLPHGARAFQKQKCLCVKEQLDEEGFYLESIQPLQYDDRYTIETPSGTAVVDCYYNAAGLYTRYVFQTLLPESETLKKIFENEGSMQFKVDYKPSCDSFEQLYAKISSLCDDIGITITNVVEHPSQYYVGYYFKTSGKFSYIQFYFKADGFITHALPTSDMGPTDEKLQSLINRMQ